MRLEVLQRGVAEEGLVEQELDPLAACRRVRVGPERGELAGEQVAGPQQLVVGGVERGHGSGGVGHRRTLSSITRDSGNYPG